MKHYTGTPDGWHIFTKPLEAFIEKNGGNILQMKEKFGGLRVYMAPNPDTVAAARINGAISFASFMADTACIFCGKEGTSQELDSGWIAVVCEEHSQQS